MKLNKIYQGDSLSVLKTMPDDYVDCIMTSPPYWGLRDYGIAGQAGLEPTLTEFIGKMLLVVDQLKRVLKPTGVLYWNHGDCYGTGSGAGNRDKYKQGTNKGSNYYENEGKSASKGYEKCLMLQNYRLILRMIDEQGWILRNDIKWAKRNSMPSSVKDRFTNSHEPVFMLVKQQEYWFDLDAVRERYKETSISRVDDSQVTTSNIDREVGFKRMLNPAGKNPGDVWTLSTQPFPEAHFATFPEKLCQKPILSSCPGEICKKCGKARERITKPTEEYAKNLGRSWHPHLDDKKRGQSGLGLGHRPGVTAEYQTIGWTDCKCNAGWAAGIVLDPFAGAGTTLVVAKKNHRNYIGIELNPEYIKIAEKRLHNTVVNQELFD